MAYDLVVLALLMHKTVRHAGSGGIVALLLNDGILFFIASIIGNGTETIFVAMRLNPIMNVMVIPLSSVISTIAATRLFRHTFEVHNSLSGTKAGTAGAFVSTMAFWNRDPHMSGMQSHAERSGGVIVVNTQIDVERDVEMDDGKVSPSELSGKDPPKIRAL